MRYVAAVAQEALSLNARTVAGHIVANVRTKVKNFLTSEGFFEHLFQSHARKGNV
jgi:hypothetical protein